MSETENKLTSINPVEDHNPKYNVDKDKLKSANEKILKLSSERRPETVAKGDMLVHKRTSKQYKEIWNAFYENELKDFEEKMGYGYGTKKVDGKSIVGIKAIGKKKFIDFMDWRNAKDVSRWRTDALHVIPCVHCQKEFAIFEHLGLCESCQPKYDIDKFSNVCAEVEKDMPGYSGEQRILFVFDKQVRSMFLKKEENK